ncbi:hypothetical protein [Thermococcus sp. 21S7]|uniref:hypothetical protein n=1 Tax=Thermococcus sp. 21S7 TaxID=1638221 RepID=UPI001438ACCE|nr:hypothetical protein [Thermococcus sp. 21S7]NJE61596.1 hypothetical protein [Thermococcus sp. 21S7]
MELMEVRRLRAFRKDYAFLLIALLCASIVTYLRGMDLLGTFLLALGFGFFFSSMEGYLVIRDGNEYRLSARKKGPVYEVRILKNGSPLWMGRVLDYIKVDELSLDWRSDEVAVIFRGREVGKLP